MGINHNGANVFIQLHYSFDVTSYYLKVSSSTLWSKYVQQ